MNNKIILNSKKPRLKMSKIEKKLNLYLSFVFAFLMLCCVECSFFHHFHYKINQKFYDNFVFIAKYKVFLSDGIFYYIQNGDIAFVV